MTNEEEHYTEEYCCSPCLEEYDRELGEKEAPTEDDFVTNAKKVLSMFVPEDDGSAMDWIENTLSAYRFHILSQRDREIVEMIETLRERIIGGRELYQMHDLEKVMIRTCDDILSLINKKV